MGRELGVTAHTVIRWEAAGIITAEFKIGKTIRFNPAKVMKELASKKPKPVKKAKELMVPTY